MPGVEVGAGLSGWMMPGVATVCAMTGVDTATDIRRTVAAKALNILIVTLQRTESEVRKLYAGMSTIVYKVINLRLSLLL
jgi:hypothetical protein